MAKIDLKVILPELTIDPALKDKWKSDLLYKRELIYKRLYSKIDNIDKYREFIAYLSYIQWRRFINPSFPRAEYIKLKQYVKVYAGGRFWHYRVYYAFQPGNAFEQGVTQNADKWFDNAIEVLRVNRPRYLGWGVAEIYALGLTGDMRAKLYLEEMKKDPAFAGKIVDNGFEPDLYIVPHRATLDRPQIIDVITWAVMFGYYAYVGTEDDNFATQVMQNFEAILKDILDKDKNSGVTIHDVQLRWDSTYHRPYIYIHVEKT